MQTTRQNNLLSERRAVSAFPSQRRTGGLAQSFPGTRLSSAPSGKRSLEFPLSNLSSSNSAVLNDWLSRTSSAVSVQSMRTSSRYYSTNSSSAGEAWDERSRHCRSSSCFSSCSRPTRASILRQKTFPVRGEQPNYQEVIKKRKAFTLRCKSLSASNIRCKTIPGLGTGGESLHAFMTGARYNRAHHMDSQSLERVGVYISRCDATRSFVNQSSIQFQTNPQDTSGTGDKTHLDVTDRGEVTGSGPPSITNTDSHEVSNPTSATSLKQEKPERQQSSSSNSSSSSSNEITNSDRRDSTHEKQSYHSNHAIDPAAEIDANSILKPPNERQATSRQVLTPTSPMSKEILVSDGAQDPKECDSEIVPGSSTAASANGSQEVVSMNHKHANIEDLSSPQHSRVGPLLSTATEDVLHIIQQQKGEQELPQAEVVVVTEEDSEDELISPEARALITDEILKECQRSSSSFTSSSVSQDQETEIMQDNDVMKINDPLLSHPQKQLDSVNIHTRNGELLAMDRTSNAKNDVGEHLQENNHDLQAESSERELSAKSSCIFVDMSSLNLDQVQEEEAID